MFTRDFSRLRLACSTLGVIAVTGLVVLEGLQALARTAESSGAYPYQEEDWLRYLLPSLWPGDRQPLVLLTGPSTARENLLGEEFAAAFPGHRVFQGGISAGTLTDIMASLQYVERVHGPEALPEIMVLGVSPRFLAEVPADRPFAIGLNQYSRWYRVPDGPRDGFGLVRKPVLRGLLAEARFLTRKQPARYRTALAWLVTRAIGPEASERLWASPVAGGFVRSGLGERFLPPRLRELGIHEFARERISPQKYLGSWHLDAPGLERWVDDPESFWGQVRRWDLAGDSLAVRRRALALIAFAEAHRIDTYVVNLPERSIGRVRHAPGFDARFRRYLTSVFEPLPVLDLRDFLADAEFRDVEHALPEGARRVTRQVIAFMEEVIQARAARLALPPAHGSTPVQWTAQPAGGS